MPLSDKINSLPPYLFARIDAVKKELLAKGKTLINLSIGDPDMPTPPLIIEAMKRAVEKPSNHQYPAYDGSRAYKEAVARWMKTFYQLSLNVETEVLALIGSKEGIAHIPFTVVNPGDVVLVPSPGYPVYPVSTMLAGGVAYPMPLKAENGFKPDFDAIPADVLAKAKLMFLNYPNNPTSASADRPFYEKAIAFVKKHNIVIAHDAAYIEMFYDGKRPLSILQVPGGMDVAIEFHSLSKTFNMTGWRLGFAIGNAALVGALGKLKTNIDSGVFTAVQEAGIAALDSGETLVEPLRALYRERRDILIEGLRKGGLHPMVPESTFYVWSPLPAGFDSASYAIHLMETYGIIATPGNGFGDAGEGYIRFSLTSSTETLRKAAEWLSQSSR